MKPKKCAAYRKREKSLVSINAVCIVNFFFFLRGVSQPPQNLTAANLTTMAHSAVFNEGQLGGSHWGLPFSCWQISLGL